ncbi:glycoside hydrolase family 13 protein [Pseudonocardia sp. T1-2H]|uniref:glycoside hydrolase family 13 protein n=1 Tax=Pseudonocardia sp. T1-2H TaxID=3128899 RepID=UPI003101179C
MAAPADRNLPVNDPDDASWWRSAVIYQVYIRSFADGNGDGVGDIAGLRDRLPYLADLGVDAVWINPWYPSPLVDAGYDVSDYRAIEPRFGTLADAEALIADAHERGMRIILDVVPNHTSSAHVWFGEALRAGPGSPERDRYVFRPGRGPGGDEPPNDWKAMFGGGAWTRVTEPDGTPGEWYLHLFDVEQPDLNWENPEVRADFEQTLRFWFDRGIDGFRIDVANSLIKETGLPDVGTRRNHEPGPHPHWDRDEVHDVYRDWRRIADTYDPPRVFVAEAWVPEADRFARYLRADELHTAFNFDFLQAAWLAPALRESVTRTLREHAVVGAPPTWVLSNHDVARHVSRLARDPDAGIGTSLDSMLGTVADLELGLRRARAAALLIFALPGGAYVYQGDELGLPEVEDLPPDVLDDPTWRRSGHTERGRDGCRVPIPWSGDAPPFGFGEGEPWLPQPEWFAEHTAEALAKDPDSILNLYRSALRLRRENPALGDGPLTWLDAPEGALAFARDRGFVLVLNVSAEPLPLPAGAEIILASGPLTEDARVPADTAVWLAAH